MHISPSILRSKGNQTIKFGQFNNAEQEKDFSSKVIHKMKQGDQFKTDFCFVRRFFY